MPGDGEPGIIHTKLTIALPGCAPRATPRDAPPAGSGKRGLPDRTWFSAAMRCAALRARPNAVERKHMRFVTSSLLVGCIGLASIADANAAPWTSAKFPGEQNRAVQGCAEHPPKAGDWLCIVIRCDNPKSPLSLHFTAPGPDIEGNIELVVDENSFALSVPKSLKSPLPLSTRAQAVPNGLIDAMKSGHTLSNSGCSPATTPQPDFAGELAHGDRTDRAGMRAPIPGCRELLATHRAERRFLLIAHA